MPKKEPFTLDLTTLVVGDPVAPVVSYSELDTYRQCPLKHFLAYNQRWTKPKTEDSPLSKGTAWHALMEDHYRLLQSHQVTYGFPLQQDAQERFVVEAREFAVKMGHFGGAVREQTELQSLLEWMYDGYLVKYGADPEWQVLAVEVKLQDFLPNTGILLKGRLDLVVRDLRGKVWVVDHKSGANLPTMFDLQLDDQFGLYSWLFRERGVPVQGSIHNAARTTRNLADHPDYDGKSKPQTLEQRMLRSALNRSDTELTNIALDAASVARLLHPTEGETPLYSSPDPRQCSWKCDFSEVHLLARTGRSLPDVLPEYGFEQDFTRH